MSTQDNLLVSEDIRASAQARTKSRRRAPRTRANWPALCHIESQPAVPVTVIDASPGGFGLSKDLPAAKGTEFLIEIDQVGVFSCELVWKANGRCGVRFLDEPVSLPSTSWDQIVDEGAAAGAGKGQPSVEPAGRGELGAIEFHRVRKDSLASRILGGVTGYGLLRYWRRTKVEVNARVLGRRGTVSVVITDISRHGAGGAAEAPLTPDELFTVKFKDEQAVPGRVVWTKNNRFGLQFLKPLETLDEIQVDMSDPSQRLEVAGPGDIQDAAGTYDVIPARWKSIWQWAIRPLEDARKGLIAVAGRALHARRVEKHRRRDQKMLERACREQGFAWLATDQVFTGKDDAKS